MNKPPLRTVLSGLGYTAWFLFLFVLLTWLTLPWSRVRDQLMVEAADSGWDLQIDSMGSAIVGVKARDVSLARAGDGDGPAGPALLKLEKARIRTGIGGALSGGLALRSIAAQGGVSPTEFSRQLIDSLGRLELDAKAYGGTLDLANAARCTT